MKPIRRQGPWRDVDAEREIHRFTSPSEIERVLTAAEWSKWTRPMSWRERDVEFDWPSIRERLQAELTTSSALWSRPPSR